MSERESAEKCLARKIAAAFSALPPPALDFGEWTGD